jgi:hypothetical protein
MDSADLAATDYLGRLVRINMLKGTSKGTLIISDVIRARFPICRGSNCRTSERHLIFELG